LVAPVGRIRSFSFFGPKAGVGERARLVQDFTTAALKIKQATGFSSGGPRISVMIPKK
jgi:hypothetical protein